MGSLALECVDYSYALTKYEKQPTIEFMMRIGIFLCQLNVA